MVRREAGRTSLHVLAIAAASVVTAAAPALAAGPQAGQAQAGYGFGYGSPYGMAQMQQQYGMPQMQLPQSQPQHQRYAQRPAQPRPEAAKAITGYDTRYPQAPLADAPTQDGKRPQTYATSAGYGYPYGAPYPGQYAAPPGYGVPGGFDPYAPVPANATTAPGYVVPGATAAPYYGAPEYGYPAPGFPGVGYSPFDFAPAEPIYAPAERFGGSAATAPSEPAKPVAAAEPAEPVYVPVEQAATPEPAKVAPASETTSYQYEIAPAGREEYVGTTQQPVAPASSTVVDPYSVVTQQPAAQQPVYQPYEPSYQTYQSAPAAPAPAPQPNYEVYQNAPAPAAPAGYEYEAVVPQQVYVEPAPVPQAYAPQGVAGHFVQVAAFLDPSRAENLRNKLGASGENAFIVDADVRGKRYYRVRIPAGDKREARYVRDRVRNLGYYEARVVKG